MINRWTIEVLSPVVAGSKTYVEVLRKIGLREFCGNYKTLKKYIKKFNLSIEHFEYHGNKNCSHKKPLEEILIFNSNVGSYKLKKRLLKEGIFKNVCSKCGQDDMWNGEHIDMVLDHINGDSQDHRLENIRLLCPNCNSQLPTNCGKNIKKKHFCKKCKKIITKNRTGFCIICYKEYLLSKPKIEKVFNRRKESVCIDCGAPIRRNKSGRCNKCVDRSFIHYKPTKEELIDLIKTTPMIKIGRIYGVTDNAVRKWCKKYNIHVGNRLGYWTKIKYNNL